MRHLLYIAALLFALPAFSQPVNRIKLRQLQSAPDTSLQYFVSSQGDTAEWVLVSTIGGGGSGSTDTLYFAGDSGTPFLRADGDTLTIAGAGIASTSASGSTITVTATEVDGSTTNELGTVSSITYVPDTTGLAPKAGDAFINATADTLGLYSGTGWVLFYGGGGGSGSDETPYLIDTVTVSSGGAFGKFVYQSTVDNEWRLADRDADTTLAHAVIIDTLGSNSYVIQSIGLATISSHGYTVGANYSLSSTAGDAVLSSSLSTGNDQWLFTVRDANTIDLKMSSLTSDLDNVSLVGGDTTAFAITSYTADGTTTVDFQSRPGGYFQIDMGSTTEDSLTFSNPATSVVPTYRIHWQSVTTGNDTITLPSNVFTYAGDTLASRELAGNVFLECYYDYVSGKYYCNDTLGTSVTMPIGTVDDPTDISGLIVWLRADSAYTDASKTTLATNEGDLIYTWDDLSGNGNDFTQATSGNRPTLDSIWTNLRPAINFDGVDNYLSSTVSNSTSNYTFFFVYQSDLSLVGTIAGHYLFDNQTDRTIIAALGPTSDVTDGNAAYYDGGWKDLSYAPGTANHISVWVLDNAGSDIIYNNTSRYTGTYSQRILGTDNAIGSNYLNNNSFFDGKIAEVIIYNRALSSLEINQMELYLNARYSIY